MKKNVLDYILTVCIVFSLSCAGQEEERYAPQHNVQPKQRIQTMTSDSMQSPEPGLDGNDILFIEDFETPDYKERWRVHWSGAVGAGTVTSPSKYVFAGRRSAYLVAKKGQHKSEGSGEYVPKTPIDDVAYVRLYLRLEDDFSMGTSRHVKLFGIRGGATLKDAYGGAGKRPTGTDKFSANLVMNNWRDLGLYYYHPDQPRRYGEIVYCQVSFWRRAKLSPGKWYCLELMLRTNTPGQRNGQLRAWMDGRLICEVNNLRFRDVNEVRIQRFTVGYYFGGAKAKHTSPRDQRIYIDNFVVSRDK